MSSESVYSEQGTRWTWPWLLMALAILAAAIYLRVVDLGEPSLWFDEILHVGKTEAAMAEPGHRWITGLQADQENGPLYYAMQRVALGLSRDEAAIRAIPAALGVGTVVLVFFVAMAATGDRRVGLIAAAVLAFSPLHVYYSREARPYAAIMLMATVLLGLLLVRRRPWTIPAVYGACLCTAYLGAVSAPVLISFGALALLDWVFNDRPRSPWPGHYFVAALLGVGIVALLFPAVQRITTTAGHREFIVTNPLSLAAANRLAGSLTVSGVEWASSTPRTVLILSLALLGGLVLARRHRWNAILTTGMFLLPIAISLTVLVALERWYNIRYTSAGLPAMAVLTAMGIVGLMDSLFKFAAKRRVERRVPQTHTIGAILLTAALVIPGWSAARLEPLQKPDWRGLAGLIEDLAVEQEPVITQSWWSELCLRYYLGQTDRQLEIISSRGDVARAQQLAGRDQPAWIASAGYVKADEFRRWMHGTNAVVRGSLANLDLFYHPDFASFLAPVERSASLLRILERQGQTGLRQDFGTSEIMLGSGWSYPEQSQDGTSFRWAISAESELGFVRTDTSDATLRLRMLPFPGPDLPGQTVDLLLNSQPLAGLELEPGWRDYQIEVPGAMWQTGANLLAIRFAWQHSPVEIIPESPDQRALAVAFDRVEIVPISRPLSQVSAE